jgi:hypothetical protein
MPEPLPGLGVRVDDSLLTSVAQITDGAAG